MKLKTYITIGTLAFSVWRGANNMRRTVRRNLKSQLKRAQKAI